MIGAAAASLRVGDNVYLRHAKAGELCERFNSLYLLSGGEIADEVPLTAATAAASSDAHPQPERRAVLAGSCSAVPGSWSRCSSARPWRAPAALAQPNVVVVMTDDQTAASVPAMPQTNACCAAQGTRFDQAFASFPLCCPSRATNLTGQYAHNHGVLHNSGTFGGFKALDNTNTLPVWLQSAGYRTMHVGRYLNGYEYRDGIPAGYSDWYGSPHSSAFNYSSWKVNENGVLRSYPAPARPGEYETDQSTRRAVGLIEEAAPSGASLLPVALVRRPHRGKPARQRRSREPGHALPRAPPPRRLRRAIDAPLPNFNEKSMYDKPQVVADRPRFTPTRSPGSRRTGARSSRPAGGGRGSGQRRRRPAVERASSRTR